MIPFIIQSIENEHDRQFAISMYENYIRLIYSEVLKVERDPSVVEDIVQETITRLLPRIDLLATLSQSNLTNYIISTAKNTAYSFGRIKRKHKYIPMDNFDRSYSDLGTSEDDMDANLIHEAELDLLREAFEQLSDRDRSILESKYFLNKSDGEIAQDLGVKASSVRMLLTRARQHLMHTIKNLSEVKRHESAK